VRVEADRRLQIKDWEEGPSKSETRASRSQTSREEKENGINALFDNDIPFRAEFHRNISDFVMVLDGIEIVKFRSAPNDRESEVIRPKL
jgi:hypothetical protein